MHHEGNLRKMIPLLALLLFISTGLTACVLLKDEPQFLGNGKPEGSIEYGFIEGRLSYPDQDFMDMVVVAYNLDTGERHIIRSEGRETYRIEVPSGKYHVYAYLSLIPGYWAYYNEYVASGMTSCGQGKPIVVEVNPGLVTNGIDPIDWDHYIDDRFYERHG